MSCRYLQKQFACRAAGKIDSTRTQYAPARHTDARDYADLARLGHVTRPRLTQIMELFLLAPDIQEEILFLPAVTSGDDLICK